MFCWSCGQLCAFGSVPCAYRFAMSDTWTWRIRRYKSWLIYSIHSKHLWLRTKYIHIHFRVAPINTPYRYTHRRRRNYLHVSLNVKLPEEPVLALLFGSDSHTTLPSVSLRIYLYWKVVPAGKLSVTDQVG